MTDDTIQPSSVRIPPDLKAAVTRRAKAANRTFSQEVVWVLQRHVDSTPEPKSKKS